MSHFTDTLSLDKLLDDIANNADRMLLCSAGAAITSYATAVSRSLGSRNLTTGYSSSDYTKGNGSPTNSRKLTVAEQASISMSAAGDYQFLVLVDTVTGGGRIKHIVDKGSSIPVTETSTLTEPEFDITVIQPVTES